MFNSNVKMVLLRASESWRITHCRQQMLTKYKVT